MKSIIHAIWVWWKGSAVIANVTGNTILGPDVGAKRLQVLKEAIPTVSRVAFLWNPDNASNVLQFEEVQAVAPTLGVTVISVSVSPRIEFETAFAAMMKERPDAFAMTAEPFHQTHIAWIMEFMSKCRGWACDPRGARRPASTSKVNR